MNELTVFALLTAIFLPFKNAPWPNRAVYSSFVMGLKTIPIRNSFFKAKATEIAVNGMPWTKLLVPSTGSIIHVGASVRTSSALVSSAIKLIFRISTAIGKC